MSRDTAVRGSLSRTDRILWFFLPQRRGDGDLVFLSRQHDLS
jgi:hypothetical protein